MTEFQETVYQVVRNIPKGQTMTYAEVAAASGSPRAYRAVASIMANNYDPSVPCHRVIRSDGSVGDYNRGGTMVKRSLLVNEGVLLSE